MTSQENSLNWFEISVKDLARAKKFYEKVFGIKMTEMDMMGMKMAFFPWEGGSGKANGALVQSKMHKPSKAGAKIYLNANPNLTKALSKVEKAGGKVTMPKTKIEQFGHMAFFEDTEGNSVAMHSNK
ncbi:MAG: VOC family protein [Saprospiraceae bacterium]|nr:VOC family protein [Saprospiraceae bacterium]